MKYNRNVYQALTMITQFGINMLVPIFLCSFAGMFLDRKLGTSFWMVLLFFVGTLAGFTNVFRFAKRIYETPAVTRRRSTAAIQDQGESGKAEAAQKENGGDVVAMASGRSAGTVTKSTQKRGEL